MTIKFVSALELRKGLSVLTDELKRTGKPVILMNHGQKVAGIVPVVWAEVIDRIARSEQYGTDSEVYRTVLKKVLERALLEVATDSQISLSELIKKLAEYVTAVQSYHNLQKSLKLTDT